MTPAQLGRWRIGRRVQLTLFSGLSALLLVVTIVLTTQVFLQLDDYLTTQKDDLIRSISRLEVEQLKLHESLYRYQPDLPESAVDVEKQIAALTQQADLITSNPEYLDLLGDAAATPLGRINDTIQTVEAQLAESSGQSVERQIALERLTANLGTPIAELLDIAVTADRLATLAERRTLENRLLQVSLLSVALLLALMSLTLLLWQLYRLYRHRALENQTTLKRLETILNTSQDAVMVVCPDGRIIDTNRAAEALFFDGDSPSPSTRIDQVLLRKDPNGVVNRVSAEMLQKSCETGPNLCANVIAQTAKGTRLPVELSNDRAKRGGQTVVICFIRNIARRLADQAEVLAARDTALSGEKAKARFLGMISHEMRTPLNGLLGTLDLLQDTKLSKEQAKLTKIMQSSGQALLTQINDALDITQAQQGALSLNDEVFDLDKLVKKLLREQGLSGNLRGNTLHHAPPPTDPLGVVRGDPNRVHQVLLNLISNAIKFTENGQITIEACRCVPNDPDLVEFQITDTGIGIDKADHARIFDDFVRLESGAQAIEGSGLGLGIVRHLVELMGGDLGLESEPGLGSVFWVRLPLPPASESTRPEPRQATLPDVPMDILIVEDNPINRTVLEEMLRQDGHRVWQATNGAEGVELATEQRFDLILMDISMPVMDGSEAARRIRQGNGISANSRILALSAHPTPTLATSPGIDGVLMKPLRRAELRAALAGVPLNKVDPGAHPMIDPQRLKELRTSLSDDKISDLLDGFEAEGDALFSRLPALTPDDPAPLITDLHQFAGLAATVGAMRLQQALGSAETALHSGEHDSITSSLSILPSIWAETQAHLSRRRKAA
ncbi:hybrid sensor histidine kinase/response regulator [Roseovarius sp. 2305UL8-3]|uniref:hybrid sensor histidine kinase/response regulator n=1 Tax=Roseovarius conchicola TaxID=3121636 RepID=UPI003528A5C3